MKIYQFAQKKGVDDYKKHFYFSDGFTPTEYTLLRAQANMICFESESLWTSTIENHDQLAKW